LLTDFSIFNRIFLLASGHSSMKNSLRVSAITAAVAVFATVAVPASRQAEAASENAHSRQVSSGRVAANAVIGGSFIANARAYGTGTRINLAPQSAYGEVGLPYDPVLTTARQISQPLPDGGVQLVVRLVSPTPGPITALAQIYSVNGERFVQFLLSDPAPGASASDADSDSAPARSTRRSHPMIPATAALTEDAAAANNTAIPAQRPVAAPVDDANESASQRRANAIERHAAQIANASNSSLSADGSSTPAAPAAAPKTRILGYVSAQSGDSLRQVAARIAKPSRVNAMANALFARNPQAFSDETENSLKANARLGVPSNAKNMLSDDGLSALGLPAASASSALGAAPASQASANASDKSSSAQLRRQLDQKKAELANLKSQEARVISKESATQAQIDALQAKLDAANGSVSASSGASGAAVAAAASAPSVPSIGASSPSFAAPAFPVAKGVVPNSATPALPFPASFPRPTPKEQGPIAAMVPPGAPGAPSFESSWRGRGDVPPGAPGAPNAQSFANGFSPAPGMASAPAAASSSVVMPAPIVAPAIASQAFAVASSVPAASASANDLLPFPAPGAHGAAAASDSVAASSALPTIPGMPASMAMPDPNTPAGHTAMATMATQARAQQARAAAAKKGPASAPVAVSTDASVPPNSFLEALWESSTGKLGLGALFIVLLGYAGFKVRQKRKDNQEAATLQDTALAPGEQAGTEFPSTQDGTTRGSAPQDQWESVFESFETHMRLGDDAGASRILESAEASSDPVVRLRAEKARARLDARS